MHHQARVAFGLHGVTAIIVNPVAVEGQGRVTKQQHIVWNDTVTFDIAVAN
jgi:hypothetical protein